MWHPAVGRPKADKSRATTVNSLSSMPPSVWACSKPSIQASTAVATTSCQGCTTAFSPLQIGTARLAQTAPVRRRRFLPQQQRRLELRAAATNGTLSLAETTARS